MIEKIAKYIGEIDFLKKIGEKSNLIKSACLSLNTQGLNGLFNNLLMSTSCQCEVQASSQPAKINGMWILAS